MNDQELIKKLHSLRENKPESAWKQETRDILLAQISNSAAEEVKVSGWEMLAADSKNFFSFLPANAWAVICLAVILAGGTMGTLAIKNSRPGDTLYTAKAWKEKVQLALTFNQEDKAKLDMKLASIHAEEIAEVLSSPSFNAAANPKRAEQLAQNFQQEINTVKASYSVISNLQNNQAPAIASAPANNTSSNLAGNDNAKVGIGDLQKTDDSKVYGVEAGKENKGMQFYDPNAAKNATGSDKASSSLNTPQSFLASSSGVSGSSESSSSSSTAPLSDNINISLDKAAESFLNDTKNSSAVKNINDILNQVIASDSGAVKGAFEAGTSTAGADSGKGNSTGTSSSSSTK